MKNFLISFVNKHKWIAGASYILSILFSEGIPVSKTVGDIPAMLSVRFFLDPFPYLNSLASLWLALPAFFFLLLSIIPLTEQRFHPGFCLLFLIHFLLYPAEYFTRTSPAHPLVWALLIFPVIGLNLWVRSLSYFYAMMLAAGLLDLGAALRGAMLGYSAIGVPYHPGLPPQTIIFMDSAFLLLIITLWWKRVDFGKLTGWEWLRAKEE